MKLRLKENSIRFRLLRSEVTTLAEKGAVYETIQFGPTDDDIFTYSIVASDEVTEISAHFLHNRMLVKVPESVAREWALHEQVGLEASQVVGEDGALLTILIEKDFVCIGRPDDPDNADAFPIV